MGIDLDSKLVESAYKVSTGRNEYNDVVYTTNETASPCLYKEDSINVNNTGREDINLDGTLWFGASEDVSIGDVYMHESGIYLQIERLIKAKRLVADNAVKFIKCEVTKQRQVS